MEAILCDQLSQLKQNRVPQHLIWSQLVTLVHKISFAKLSTTTLAWKQEFRTFKDVESTPADWDRCRLRTHSTNNVHKQAFPLTFTTMIFRVKCVLGIWEEDGEDPRKNRGNEIQTANVTTPHPPFCPFTCVLADCSFSPRADPENVIKCSSPVQGFQVLLKSCGLYLLPRCLKNINS